MQQTLNKLVKQEAKINRDISKIYYNIEKDEEKINEINKEIKTIQRAVRIRKKNKTKLRRQFLRRSEMKKSKDQFKRIIQVC